MALTQAQIDLEHILRNKSGKNKEEEDLLKALHELKANDTDPVKIVKYTEAKTKKDNRT